MNAARVSVEAFRQCKNQRKLSVLTCYDFSMASWLDQTEVDALLVGDSVGNVILGYENTLPVTLDEMLMFTKAVRRGTKRALLIADVPAKAFFGNDHARSIAGIRRLFDEGGADAVKIEGVDHLAIITELVKQGLPVMGHIGFTPQLLEHPRLQGKDPDEAIALMWAAEEVEKAGAFALVLELVKAEVAEQISKHIKIPTIGIGSGPRCDGQVLVTHDLVGLYGRATPKFVKSEADLGQELKAAVQRYIARINRE